MAAEFRRAFTAAVTDPDTPMWNGEPKDVEFGVMFTLPGEKEGGE